AVGVIAIDDDVRAQFAQDAGGRFVSGAVGAIDHHAHSFEGHAARERSFGIFNVTAEGILDAHGLADFIGGGTDVFDAATEDEVFDLMLDLVFQLITVCAEKFNAVVIVRIVRGSNHDAGIVITASHNPYDDNGIKFFRADGYKLEDKIEHEIEDLVFSGRIENIRPTADEIGKAVRIEDALGRYIEYAKASFPRGMTLEGMRVVVDCAHGAGYKSTPCVLRELGADVIVYGNHPDGKNINKECGSMHPKLMCQKVWEHRADVGIAHDGDADRVLLCDETGKLIDGDDIMAIAGLDMLQQNRLAEK